jgi:hypothetical protein
MTLASIGMVAWRRGGQNVLATLGADGTPQLRDAITNFARDGNAAVVNDTITSLFGNASSLSDEQVGTLADHLVENWKP